MLSFFLAALLEIGRSQGRIVAPTAGAVCMGSSAITQIGTDNLGNPDNTIGTSIVNIWGFAHRESGSTIAWLYKNAIGDYYLQFPKRAEAHSYLYIKNQTRFFSGKGQFGYVPEKISPAELISIENLLGAHDIVRLSCFTRDFKM